MGYALFASRKLMLTNTINMLNLELTNVMNKRSNLTQLGISVADGKVSGADIANCNASGIAMEYGIELEASKLGKYNDPQYYAGLADSQNVANKQIGSSTAANVGKGAVIGGALGAGAVALGLASGPIGWVALGAAALGGVIGGVAGKLSSKTQASDKYVQSYDKQYETTLTDEKAKEIQQRIALMENELEKKQKTIETKIQAYQSDLEATEKAEATAIKNATPKYSGVQ